MTNVSEVYHAIPVPADLWSLQASWKPHYIKTVMMKLAEAAEQLKNFENIRKRLKTIAKNYFYHCFNLKLFLGVFRTTCT